MINEALIGLSLMTSVSLTQIPIVSQSAIFVEERTLAKEELKLTDRLADKYGNEVFSDNILLSLHYLKGDVNSVKKSQKVNSAEDIDWEKVRKPFEVSFELKPGETFAFHNKELPEIKDSVVKSTNSKFITTEGYKVFAGLGGNGVCHIASLVNMTSKKGGLEVISKVNHDFYPIPDVPREYGTSIFSDSEDQNLYIKNNLERNVNFVFKITENKVILEIKEK